MKNPVVQGAIVVGLCLAALCFPTNPQNEIMKWIAVMLVSGLVHFGICRHVVLKKNELGFKTVFLIAVALRLLVLFHDPVLSDDGFRNVWDGRMQIEGMNPYAYAPSSENLAALRDVEVWPRINHKEYRTIYPPTSQL
ncbi:MAG: hypothetical protein JKX97_05210, partial [Candidatus Lindowbacteria bacterium]|nr:hypothetical protein [Candidatus Lindowbacteria bacterium]